jgi:hypothetical protein
MIMPQIVTNLGFSLYKYYNQHTTTMARKDELVETQIVHFTVGENAGKLLIDIAQEHLLYNYNPEKAVRTLTESLSGCPMDIALKLLRGDYVLLVDVKKQEFILTERIPEVHDRIFRNLDAREWSRYKSEEMAESGRQLKRAIDKVMSNMKYNKVRVAYDYGQILRYIAGEDKSILEDLLETNEEVSQLASLVNVTREYITKSMKIASVIDWMKKTYPEDFKDYFDGSDSRNILTMVMDKFKSLYEMDFSEIEKEQEALSNYIESARKIDEVLSKGIHPCDILANWSAGWLCPSGNYYGLNGEIANMLHIQIADALKEDGIIPEDCDNPDAWLEQQGWVKIHGNNVQFAGCLNVQLGKRNVDLTDIQIEKICDYIHQCHGDKIKLGWRLELMSIGTFKMLANNLDAMYKKYFEY